MKEQLYHQQSNEYLTKPAWALATPVTVDLVPKVREVLWWLHEKEPNVFPALLYETARENFQPQRLLEHAVTWFEAFSPDLKSKNLAYRYLQPLVSLMTRKGCKSGYDALQVGNEAFHAVAGELLGPLHVAYVDEVLSTAKSGDILLFAARDATPFYTIAKILLDKFPDKYAKGFTLVHADWNRWFMGQEDELEAGKKPIPFSDPLLQKFYEQMGFGSGRLMKIVEPGAWGSAANAIKTSMPEQEFELWFLFSHMPDKIYGFLNDKALGFPEKVYEVINDTGEALPKSYLRPDTLVEKGEVVIPEVTDKWIPSQYIQAWAGAAKSGSISAAYQYQGEPIDIAQHVAELAKLSEVAQKKGVWTGMLPENTQTWTGGEAWKANWPWGEIPPLT